MASIAGSDVLCGSCKMVLGSNPDCVPCRKYNEFYDIMGDDEEDPDAFDEVDDDE